mgnify:CR=1 FL=1
MTEKQLVPPMTKRQATRRKVVKLHKYWKGVASTILNKQDRRQYLNMILDATMSEHENKMKNRKEGKDNQGAEE